MHASISTLQRGTLSLFLGHIVPDASDTWDKTSQRNRDSSHITNSLSSDTL